MATPIKDGKLIHGGSVDDGVMWGWKKGRQGG